MLNKKDIKLSEWMFEFQQRDVHTILMSDLWCRALYKNFQKEINLFVSAPDCLFTSQNKGYVKKAQKQQILSALKKATENKSYVQYLFNSTLKRVKELENFAEKVSKKNEIEKKEVLELWKELDEIILKVVPWFYIPWYVTEENLLTDRVKEKLIKHKEKIGKITDLNNALTILIFPVTEAIFQEEQKDFFELLKLAKQDKDFLNDRDFLNKADSYLKNYAWTKTFITLPIEPLSFNELLKRIKDALKENFIEQYQLQEKQKEKNKLLAENILEKIKEDEKLVSLIEQTRELGWLLTFSVEIAMKSCSKLLKFFKLLAKELNVPYSQWNHLKSKEVIEILENQTTISAEELRKRGKSYVFMMENGEEKTLFGNEAKEFADWIDKKISQIDFSIKEIKGHPASQGIIKGKVKIVLTPRDSYSLKKGEVLVCSMTSPDYVPAMKKASAIITDEGGLLSHAAIVSRELNKPCIIGTKIATKVLKDGDLVEVDADKGVVKILKKHRQD